MSASIQDLSDIRQPGHQPGAGATRDAYNQLRRRSREIKDDFGAWANGLTKTLYETEKTFDYITYKEAVANSRYYNGDFFFRFTDESGMVRDMPHSDTDPFFPHNYFAYFMDQSIAAALESDPIIVVDPVDQDDHSEAAAKSAQRLADYMEPELFSPYFELDSEKHREMNGGVFWYCYWAMDAGKLYAERPVFQKKAQQFGGDAYMCHACDDSGPAEKMKQTVLGPRCPSCGRADKLRIIENPQIEVDEIVSYQKVPLGFPTLECVSNVEMKGDRRARPDYAHGSYLIRTRLVDKDLIADAMPWIDEKSLRYTDGSDDYSIRAAEQIRKPVMSEGQRTTPLGTFDREGNDTVFRQFWLRPAKYEFVEFEQDQVFPGGDELTIPKRTRLGEVFPDGLYLCKVSDKWVDHRPEDMRRHWTYVPYITRPGQSDGKSLGKDMREPQQEIIQSASLLFTKLMASAGGAPIIIKPPLSEQDFDGSPKSITRLPYIFEGPVESLFFQPQYSQTDPALEAYIMDQKGEMQIAAQVLSPTETGDPAAQQLGAGTAHGAVIMSNKISGLQGPKSIPVAFAKANVLRQVIELWRENVPDEDVPIPLKGKTGRSEWAILNSKNLEADFNIYPKFGSWIPSPREVKQANLQNCFGMFGESVILNPNAPQSLKEYVLETYQVDINIDDYNLDVRDAMLRIDKMTELLPQAVQLAKAALAMQQSMPTIPAMTPSQTQMPQPPQGVPGPPISPGTQPGTPAPQQPPSLKDQVAQLLVTMVPIDEDLDDHQVFMDYYKSWIKGDEGKRADPMLLAAVRLQWKAHQAQAQQQAQQQMQMQTMPIQQQEQAKTQGQIQVEQARTQGRIQEKITDAKLAPAPAPTGKTGPSTSIGMKDLPPEGQAQLAAQAGIVLDPNSIAAHDEAQKPPAKPMAPPPPDTGDRDHEMAMELERERAHLEGLKQEQKHRHDMEKTGMTSALDALRQQAANPIPTMPPPGAVPVQQPVGLQ